MEGYASRRIMKTVLFVDYEEIGAILFTWVKAINDRQSSKLKAYYVSFTDHCREHDSRRYHFGATKFDWDLSKTFEEDACGHEISNLEDKVKYLQKMVNDVGPDVIFTSGRGGYLSYQAGLKYIYWCYGSDLEQAAFNIRSMFDSFEKREFVKEYVSAYYEFDDPFRLSLSKNIFAQGIIYADKVLIGVFRSLKYIRKLKQQCKLIHLPFFLGIPSYENQYLQNLKGKKRIFISTARHVWGKDRENIFDKKGNNIIVEAINLYRQKTQDSNFELYLFEKGVDVDRTKELIEQLGLTQQVKWLPQVTRWKLRQYYKEAVLALGQFGTEAFEGVALEPMLLGIPVITWVGSVHEPRFNKPPWYKTFPPVFNSKNPEEIADFMIEILNDQQKYKEISERSYQWCVENCSIDVFIEALLKLVDDTIEVKTAVEEVKPSQEEHEKLLIEDVKRWFSYSFQLLKKYEKLEQSQQQLQQEHQSHQQLQQEHQSLQQSKVVLLVKGLKKYPLLVKLGSLTLIGLDKVYTLFNNWKRMFRIL